MSRHLVWSGVAVALLVAPTLAQDYFVRRSLSGLTAPVTQDPESETLTILLQSGARAWSDGSHASDCSAYRDPVDAGHEYSGDTGDGVYAIDPGTGVTNVWCDMTTDGGGWTLVAGADAGDRNHLTTAAVAFGALSANAKGKLSDADINAIAGGASAVFRADNAAHSHKVYFSGLSAWAAADIRGTSLVCAQTYAGLDDAVGFTVGHTSAIWGLSATKRNSERGCPITGPDYSYGYGTVDSGSYLDGGGPYDSFVYVRPRTLAASLTIVTAGAGRRWSDGSHARSCAGYRFPPPGKSYSGATGDGVYTISPGGTPTDVYCDMTGDGGGWTLVAGVDASNRNHLNSAAVAFSSLAPAGKGKLSDSFIQSIGYTPNPEYRAISDSLTMKVFYASDENSGAAFTWTSGDSRGRLIKCAGTLAGLDYNPVYTIGHSQVVYGVSNSRGVGLRICSPGFTDQSYGYDTYNGSYFDGFTGGSYWVR